jgi:hypothetical protein
MKKHPKAVTKISHKKITLVLRRESVRTLSPKSLAQADGGAGPVVGTDSQSGTAIPGKRCA